ncbi:MAG: hypothetical protein ACYTEQ_23220 [Planctomycetota bacterium]|jgi:hypothetical protein
MNNSTLMMYNQQAVQHMDLGLYAGEIAVNVPKMPIKPRLRWKGAPIDRETFRIMLAFLKWTHDTHSVEGQGRFFYNDITARWRPVVLPQYIWSAGHTREVEDDSLEKEQVLAELSKDGFGEAGTIHHHSRMSAFASHGDQQDEIARHGFHVTVGHMSADIADFHARATFKKICYTMEDGMMNVADWLPGLRTRTTKTRLTGPFNPLVNRFWLSLNDLPEFPEDWKALLVEKPKTITSVASTTQTTKYGTTTTYGASAMTLNREKHRGEKPIWEDKLIRRYQDKPGDVHGRGTAGHQHDDQRTVRRLPRRPQAGPSG